MKKTRIQKKITLRELSEMTGIGICRLSAIENGQEHTTGREVDALIIALGSGIRFPEQDEIDSNKEEFEATQKAIGKIFEDAKQRGFGKGRPGQAKIPCPKCRKDLFYRVNSFNGHVWAKCSSDNCIGFMQ